MDKPIIKDANVANIKVVGTDTYTFFSRIDGYFAVMKNDENETIFEWYIGYDDTSIVDSTTPNYDAVYADPTSVTYAIPAKLSRSQRKLVTLTIRGFDAISKRDFE